MASDALDVLKEFNCVVDDPVRRPAAKVRTPSIRASRRAARNWIALGILAAGVCVLTVQLLNHPARASGSGLEATSLPASVYFDNEHAAIDAENLEAIAAIASAVKGSPTPVVVAGYARRSGNRDQNLRLVQKQATSVRNALVTAGVPTLRIVVVSPTFTDDGDQRRVEVALVHGVRAFPAQPAGGAR